MILFELLTLKILDYSDIGVIVTYKNSNKTEVKTSVKTKTTN